MLFGRVVVNPGVQAAVVVEANVGRERRFELSEAREGPASDSLGLHGVEARLPVGVGPRHRRHLELVAVAMHLHPSCGPLTVLDTSHRTPPPSLGLGVHFIGGGTPSAGTIC